LLDFRPVLEIDLLQVAADPGPDLYGIDGRRPTGVFLGVGDFALERVADRHRWRTRSRRFRRRAGAAGQAHASPKKQSEPDQEDRMIHGKLVEGVPAPRVERAGRIGALIRQQSWV